MLKAIQAIQATLTLRMCMKGTKEPKVDFEESVEVEGSGTMDETAAPKSQGFNLVRRTVLRKILPLPNHSQNSLRVIHCWSDSKVRQCRLNVGAMLFNKNPGKGIDYLNSHRLVADGSPWAVSRFLRTSKELNKAVIGEFLCELSKPFNQETLCCFVNALDFRGQPIDIALRKLHQKARFPGELAKILAVLDVFIKRYSECNKAFAAKFGCQNMVFHLSYAIWMLGVLPSLNPCEPEDFIEDLRSRDGGMALDKCLLRSIFGRVKANPFTQDADPTSKIAGVEKAIRGIPAGNLTESARFVSFFRFDLLTNIFCKAKKCSIFVFNNTLIVCKMDGAEEVTHNYMFCVPLDNIRMFRTARCDFGVQLSDSLTGKNFATFNVHSQEVQIQFIETLQELMDERVEYKKAQTIGI